MSARVTPSFLADLAGRPGRSWLPGLSEAELAAYEAALGVRLPDDARLLLRTLNGSGDGEFYSCPRDLAAVKERMAHWASIWESVRADLAADGTPIPEGARAVPLYKHRGVLCSADPADSRVLSVVEGDSVLYAGSLRAWLDLEFPRR